ncbi:MAG: hypothetical protein IPP97_10270 [Candidatus Obscuribacter sp.]|jgi:hypothetical protein|nr:hypothetical protein [Candidatus Obscuribacter sp.]
MNIDQGSTNHGQPVNVPAVHMAMLLDIVKCDERQLQPIAGRTGLWFVTDGHFNGLLPLSLCPNHVLELATANGGERFEEGVRSGLVLRTDREDRFLGLDQLSMSS